MLERLLDSVILIDHFNDIAEASAFIAGVDPGKTAISAITYAEILVGLGDETAEEGKALLDHYEILALIQLLRKRLQSEKHSFVEVPYRLKSP